MVPDYIRVATDGKSQLGVKLNVLKNRDVVVYPDVDAYEEWKAYFEPGKWPNFELSGRVQEMATDEEKEQQADIADIVIRLLRRVLYD